jgi:hypothetical protein
MSERPTSDKRHVAMTVQLWKVSECAVVRGELGGGRVYGKPRICSVIAAERI